jgi:hypothetical protein
MSRMSGQWRKWAGAVGAVALMAGCGPIHESGDVDGELSSTRQGVAVLNNDSSMVVAYTINYENLMTPSESCKGEYQDLIYWMRDQTYVPDFIIVQQVSGQTQADALASTISGALFATYKAIVAVSSPSSMNSNCPGEKDYQTNAILYRGAFTPSGSKVAFQTYQTVSGSEVLNTQDRTISVVQKFIDSRNGKTVSVASTHWVSESSGGTPNSALRSMKEVRNRLSTSAGSLQIWGGDTNMSDLMDATSSASAFRDWYQAANGAVASAAGDGTKYAFRDAAYTACSGDKACLVASHNTFYTGTNRRIDFLMATKGASMPTMSNNAGKPWTVPFGSAGVARQLYTGADDPALNYSEHRSVSAYIYY